MTDHSARRPPGPGTRIGPRPLPLHLMSAIGCSVSSIAASAALRSGSTPWNATLAPEARALGRALGDLAERRAAESAPPRSGPRRSDPTPDAADPTDKAAEAARDALWRDFSAAVQAAALGRLDAMLTGIERYRRHPYRRDLEPPPALWREGSAALLDFRGLRAGPATGAVLLAPSLVNRAYVLDLSSECSLARWLAGRGLDVFLMDWGAPGAEENGFTLADYAARLGRAAHRAAEAAGRPPGLLGYCMGGLLALPLATGFLGPAPPIDRLVLMATPWDFHAEQPAKARSLGALAAAFEPMTAVLGALPVDVIQALFSALDPFLAMRKFAAFARMAPDGARARAFVALEDWLNDGVALAAPVARDCLVGWYGENRPARGTWRLGGFPVRPDALSVPALALAPAGDRIVPPASARALARDLAATGPGCRLIEPAVGHIGMIVAQQAQSAVWEPVRAFLSEADPARAA